MEHFNLRFPVVTSSLCRIFIVDDFNGVEKIFVCLMYWSELSHLCMFLARGRNVATPLVRLSNWRFSVLRSTVGEM